jgi:cytochrome c
MEETNMGKYLTILILLLVVGVYYTGMAQQEQMKSGDSTMMKGPMMKGHMMKGMMGDTSKSDAQVDTTRADPNSPHPKKDRGIGPITEVKLGPIDQKMADSGKKLFDQKCTACHKLGSRLVGPALGDITQKRAPVFIMNFLLNTQTMEAKDSNVKKLESEFGMRMPDPHVDKQQAREILEYLRSVAPKEEKK